MNKKSKKMKGFSGRLLALMLCCFCIFAAMPISAAALAAGESQISEAAEASSDNTELDPISPVDALFERLMAAATYEELDAMMEEMSEEEYALLSQFGDAQKAALTARIAELSENDAEPLATVTKDQVLETFKHTASGNQYQTSRVYLAVRRDGKIPGEPSDQGSASYNFYSSSYTTNSMQFASNPTGYIDQDIVDYQNFILTSVDGTDTAGLVDSTGTTTNQVLSGIQFDKLLDGIVKSGNVRATDGNIVTNSNKDNYKVVCYVIKLQLDKNYGWHIDCAVVPKEYVTLSYDINIPDGYVITTGGVGVPNSETGAPPATFVVEKMDGLTTIDDQSNAIKVQSADGSEKYAFMFQGWNTKADGSGDWYQPNGGITIEENTVLYAIWNSNPALGTGNLEIEKIVKADSVPQNAAFTFQVTIDNGDGTPSANEYDYIIYNENTIAQERGTITSGETISLKNTQYVEIRDLPAVNKADGEPNVTVKEINYDGYEPSWDGGTTVSDTTSVAIQGGRDSRVTCTNCIAAPETTTITLDKVVTGNMGDRDKNFTFTVSADDVNLGTYTLNHSTPVVTVENVPVGSAVTIIESDNQGYVVSATVDAAAVEVINGAVTIENVGADGHAVVFTNNKDVIIDTGVLLDTLPYILILSVAAVGAVLLVRKRRSRDDD